MIIALRSPDLETMPLRKLGGDDRDQLVRTPRGLLHTGEELLQATRRAGRLSSARSRRRRRPGMGDRRRLGWQSPDSPQWCLHFGSEGSQRCGRPRRAPWGRGLDSTPRDARSDPGAIPLVKLGDPTQADDTLRSQWPKLTSTMRSVPPASGSLRRPSRRGPHRSSSGARSPLAGKASAACRRDFHS